jgi:hypothetical protein
MRFSPVGKFFANLSELSAAFVGQDIKAVFLDTGGISYSA